MRLVPIEAPEQGPPQLFGEGFPEGKVAAPVGSIYTDTLATSGAVRWIKAVGTGATGWTVEYGDTGWRTLAEWTSPGEVTSGNIPSGLAPVAGRAGGVWIKRDATHGYLAISEATTTVSEFSFTNPIGFRPDGSAPYPANPLAYETESGQKSFGILEAGVSVLRLRGVPSGSHLRSGGAGGYGVTTSWLIRRGNNWPSTLPGTPA